MGDLVRLVTLEAVLNEIKEKDLLSVARESGEALHSGLQALEVSGVLAVKFSSKYCTSAHSFVSRFDENEIELAALSYRMYIDAGYLSRVDTEC